MKIEIGTFITKLLERHDGYEGVVKQAQQALLRGNTEKAERVLLTLPLIVQCLGNQVPKTKKEDGEEVVIPNEYVPNEEKRPDFLKAAEAKLAKKGKPAAKPAEDEAESEGDEPEPEKKPAKRKPKAKPAGGT